ncbi:Hst3 protein, partial [Coniochaeta sp. 2T2.1]
MPTLHVTPGADLQLQDIANALFKAKKVVVITGAGISTNSGIPDFRSENGLYALIQAQFDAASRELDKRAEERDAVRSSPPVIEAIEERPPKRRKLSAQEDISVKNEPEPPAERGQTQQTTNQDERQRSPDREQSTARDEDVPDLLPRRPQEDLATQKQADLGPSSDSGLRNNLSSSSRLSTPRSFRLSSDTDHNQTSYPLSSSPLSSPPPILSDPYEDSSLERTYSRTDEETDDSNDNSGSSTPNLTPQSSIDSSQSKTTLPNIKGRDLFDASIWADPVRTSVFYTFATTLRQKARDVTPTTSHRFLSVLRDQRKLVRCYTQNIDRLEDRIGLATRLELGAGSRQRFSAKAWRNSAAALTSKRNIQQQPRRAAESDSDAGGADAVPSASQDALQAITPASSPGEDAPAPGLSSAPLALSAPNRGVECVFLHGSLDSLRCFLCGQTSSWDDSERELETLAGRQPTCPHCAGATAAREERGKRALGVGKLRPDIVLYGEDHPHADLIGNIIEHDISLGPDMLLILGTSLRVHSLKTVVREFAKTVHSKGGRVVFVNFTKPPDSVWSDVIDFWVQWDCDAWVSDIKTRKPALWLPPGTVKLDPNAKRPQSIRDDVRCGAFLAWKIQEDLKRLTGQPKPTFLYSTAPQPEPKVARSKKPRQSAPAVLPQPEVASENQEKLPPPPEEKPTGSKRKATKPRPKKVTVPKPLAIKAEASQQPLPVASTPTLPVISPTSISAAIKTNPRKRKRKTIDGEEVVLPTAGRRPASARPSLPTVPQTPLQQPHFVAAPLGTPQPPGMFAPGPLPVPRPSLTPTTPR